MELVHALFMIGFMSTWWALMCLDMYLGNRQKIKSDAIHRAHEVKVPQPIEITNGQEVDYLWVEDVLRKAGIETPTPPAQSDNTILIPPGTMYDVAPTSQTIRVGSPSGRQLYMRAYSEITGEEQCNNCEDVISVGTHEKCEYELAKKHHEDNMAKVLGIPTPSLADQVRNAHSNAGVVNCCESERTYYRHELEAKRKALLDAHSAPMIEARVSREGGPATYTVAVLNKDTGEYGSMRVARQIYDNMRPEEVDAFHTRVLGGSMKKLVHNPNSYHIKDRTSWTPS